MGDEGGFAPDLKSNQEALDLIVEAVKDAGYKPGKDIALALDVAASEFFDEGGEILHLRGQEGCLDRRDGRPTTRAGRPTTRIVSIEDPLDEERLGRLEGAHRRPRLAGPAGRRRPLRHQRRASCSAASTSGRGNAILVKVNQIGIAHRDPRRRRAGADRAGYRNVMCHRSGETEDTTIADLAVATNCGQIKTGAPCRRDRVAKYNRLLRIEDELGDAARYAGRRAFPRFGG